MDLNAVKTVRRPKSRAELGPYTPGQAWLAGGTWLFSEPQPRVTTLVDLAGMGWSPLEASEAGLSIAATCTVAELAAFEAPVGWRAAPLFQQCCHAFLASFKIWNTATVGGNLCIALPAGPMISLCAALDGFCRIWTAEGGERVLPVADFILDPQVTALKAGEVLRSIEIPAEALRTVTAFRQVSLSPAGRSAALLIGTLARDGRFALTVTAATRRPIRLGFGAAPDAESLRTRLAEAISDDLYYDDVHGHPDWRRLLTGELAEEIRAELAAPNA